MQMPAWIDQCQQDHCGDQERAKGHASFTGRLREDFFYFIAEIIEHRFVRILRGDGDEPLIEFGPVFFSFDRGGDWIFFSKQLVS
jgi:hypothetical protein